MRKISSFLLISVACFLSRPLSAQTNCPPGTIPIWISQGQQVQLGCSKTDLTSVLHSIGDLQQTAQDLRNAVTQLNAVLKTLQTNIRNLQSKPEQSKNNQQLDMPEKDIKEIQNEFLFGSGTKGNIVFWKKIDHANLGKGLIVPGVKSDQLEQTISELGDSDIRQDSSGNIAIGSEPDKAAKLTVFASDTGASLLARGGNEAALKGEGTHAGVFGKSDADMGVRGESNGGIGIGGNSSSNYGVFGKTVSAAGVAGQSTGMGVGVSGTSDNGLGVRGRSKNKVGVLGLSDGSMGVVGASRSNPGVLGESNHDKMPGVAGQAKGLGVFGRSAAVQEDDNGNPLPLPDWVGGPSDFAVGVRGDSATGHGVEGHGDLKAGVVGYSNGGDGVVGVTKSEGDAGAGVVGIGKRAGLFKGNVGVGGTLSVVGTLGVDGPVVGRFKAFRIDHPLDPSNKYLAHSSVESSEMTNIYSGNIWLDGNGEGLVELPGWFEALNRDFRYQLTAIGAPAPSLYVAEKVTNNKFRIAGGAPVSEVSWQISGVRHDVWAEAHPLQVEQEKPGIERGTYLDPELFGEPAEKSVRWALDPDLMLRLKEHPGEMSKPQARMVGASGRPVSARDRAASLANNPLTPPGSMLNTGLNTGNENDFLTTSTAISAGRK
jgi:hypothetical protein